MSKGDVTVRVRPATLRAFRKKERLSQAALAAKATDILRAAYPDDPDVGLSESLIALIETGRRQPSLRNGEAIAEALGVELEAIAELGAELVG